jgi:hypothetical protein
VRALLGTRKGLLVLRQENAGWKITKAHFDGVSVPYAVYDAQHRKVWAGVNHGHWGPKLHVSANKGGKFEELGVPKFPEGHSDTLKSFWSLATDSKGRIWLGVEPAALFYSDDEGHSWSLCKGMDTVHGRDKWFGGGTDAHCLHSLMIDPSDDKHLFAGISVAGMLESTDRGKSWTYINKGLRADFLPDDQADIGHDPHMTIMSPSNPQVLWQQNHCGIFKSENMGRSWKDLSKARGLKTAFGWGIAVDEDDDQTAYTVPALSDINRTPYKKKLFVQKTTDGGKSWRVIDKGLPKETCYDIVYRNALALKDKALAFGSTTGNFYFSKNRGESWKQLKLHLPPIYSVKLF